MGKLLDEDGNIAEPTSKNYGKPPCKDVKREKALKIKAYLWLLVPIVGLVPFSIYRDELTDNFGYTPWWL